MKGIILEQGVILHRAHLQTVLKARVSGDLAMERSEQGPTKPFTERKSHCPGHSNILFMDLNIPLSAPLTVSLGPGFVMDPWGGG